MVNKFTELKSRRWYANINVTKDTTINAMQFFNTDNNNKDEEGILTDRF